MNKILNYTLLLTTILSCSTRKAPNHLITKVIYNDSNVTPTLSRFNKPNIGSDSSENLYFDFNINNQKTVLIEFNKKNYPLYIREVNKLYCDKPGVKLWFNEKSNRLEQLFFTDSSYLKEGPFFIYKRNGKIKHLLLMHQGYCSKVIYTSSPKKLKEDTTYFSMDRYQVRNYRRQYGW